MPIRRFKPSLKVLDLLEQDMLLKMAQAEGAKEAWRREKLRYCLENYRFKRGDRITVRYSSGPQDYIFEDLAWYWLDECEPAIRAKKILKSGRVSQETDITLVCRSGIVPHDAMFVTLSTNQKPIKGD